jgi:low-density lipoprotein receptor-related protein 1 (alpha-2-macroglobulin receptor)
MSFNCDFFNDCSDGSDESECEQSSISQEKCDDDTFFQCEITKRCIPKKWLCDDEPDCGYIQHNGIIDISDELNCTKKCSDDEIPCSNGVCLSISKFCDKHVDCTNDEDLSICNESQCKTLKCDYDCRMTPQGPKCFCPPNQITENITKCAHPKKCRENSCDQICNINNNGEEICSCHFGYSKEGRKCVSIDSEYYFIILLL